MTHRPSGNVAPDPMTHRFTDREGLLERGIV